MNRGESVYTGPESGNRKFRARLCGLLMILALALSSQAAQAQVEVDLALCIDGSGSISTADFDLQRDAYIDALNALVPRDGTVRLSIFQFSQAIVTELSPLVIAAEGDMTTVITALNDMVQEDGVTNTEGCIRTAADAIDSDELQARKIIDMSTDGVPTWNVNGDNCVGDPIPNVCSDAAIQASDDIELAGIINAFNVIAVGPGAPLDYMDDLPFPAPVGSPSGGYPDPGSPPDTDGFIVPVATFDAFETALEQKLLLELSVSFEVTKSWVGAAAPGEVTIQLACDGTDVLIDGMASPQSKLTTGNVASFSVTGSDVGLCTATETTDISGMWTVDDDDCAAVDPAEQLTCTITNTRNAYTLTVVKDLEPDADPGLFVMDADGTPGTEGGEGANSSAQVTGGTTADFGETAGTGTSLADYTSSFECLGDTSATDYASGPGTGSSFTMPDEAVTCTITNVLIVPGLTLVKVGSGPDADYDGVGDTLSYTFSVENTGNVPLAGPVTIDDDLTTDEACPALSTVGNGDGNLDPGETIVCTASYIVGQGDLDAGSVGNCATAAADGTTSNEDCDTLDAEQAPGLDIDKTGSFQDESGDGAAQVGETVFYNLTVTNTGNVTLTSISVSDPLVSPILCASGNPIPSLAPGAQENCTGSYAVTQNDIDSGSVFNLASACVAPPGGGELCDEDSHNETLPSTDLAIPSMSNYGLLLMVLALMLTGLYGYRVRGHKRVA